MNCIVYVGVGAGVAVGGCVGEEVVVGFLTYVCVALGVWVDVDVAEGRFVPVSAIVAVGNDVLVAVTVGINVGVGIGWQAAITNINTEPVSRRPILKIEE